MSVLNLRCRQRTDQLELVLLKFMYVNFRSFPFKKLETPSCRSYICEAPRYPLFTDPLNFLFYFVAVFEDAYVMNTNGRSLLNIYLQIRIWRQLSRMNELQVRIWMWCTSRLMILLRIYVTKSKMIIYSRIQTSGSGER